MFYIERSFYYKPIDLLLVKRPPLIAIDLYDLLGVGSWINCR
jgi:hypothetical protein